MTKTEARNRWAFDPQFISLVSLIFAQTAAIFMWAGATSEKINSLRESVTRIDSNFVTAAEYEAVKSTELARDMAQDDRLTTVSGRAFDQIDDLSREIAEVRRLALANSRSEKK